MLLFHCVCLIFNTGEVKTLTPEELAYHLDRTANSNHSSSVNTTSGATDTSSTTQQQQQQVVKNQQVDNTNLKEKVSDFNSP